MHKEQGKRHLLALVLVLIVLLAGCAKALSDVGGTRLTFTVSCLQTQPRCDLGAKISNVLNILKQRGVDGLQDADTNVRQDGADRVAVELPGYTDIATARSVLGTRGELVVLDTASEQVPVGATILKNGDYIFPVVFTGTQLDRSQIRSGLDEQSGQPIVTFGFAGGAKQAFGEYTRNNIGNYLTIALDGIVIESATIQSEIDGQAQITGLANLTVAHTLAAQLKSGPLPLQLSLDSAEQVKPPK